MASTTLRVLLIRKLSDYIDGIDLVPFSVGDVLDMPLREASLLMAEGWAEPVFYQNASATAVKFRARDVE
jgi:hypothetical protein